MIRSLSILLFVLLVARTAAAQDSFYSGSWNETLEKAKAENKFVLVDCYTDWCYWCKEMDKKTFPDTAVARELSTHFVAIRREMQQTDEGRRLRLKYQVQGFPTYLILSPYGQLLNTIDGYYDPDVFLQKLRDSRLQQPLPGYSTKLDPGYPQYCFDMMDPAKVKESKANHDHYAEMAQAHLDSMPNLLNEAAWGILWMFPELCPKYEKWTYENIDTLTRLYGRVNVQYRVKNNISMHVASAAELNDRELLTKALADCRYLGADSAPARFEMQFFFASMRPDWKMMQEMLQRYTDTADFSSSSPAFFLNDVCWNIYERCDDSSVVASAAVWMEKSSRLYPSFELVDTYAALLYKSGELKKAEPVTEEAVALGKKDGKDVSDAEERLRKIRKALAPEKKHGKKQSSQ